MDEKDLPQTLEGCHQLIKQLVKITKSLVASNDALTRRVEKLEQENKALKELLNQNSSNSSLPPSKDKKKKKAKGALNKGGGQVGHKGHFRKLLDEAYVDKIVACPLPKKCACGGRFVLKELPYRHQVYELPPLKLHVTEYQLAKGCCVACRKNQVACLPAGVPAGITGPNLTSFMTQLLAKYKLSRRELQEFLNEQFGFKLSLGSVFNKQKLVTQALVPVVDNLLEQVKDNTWVNMDETSHRRDGNTQWLWTIMSDKAAYFSIEASRGKKVIKRLMADFNQVVISDRYAAYNVFDSHKRQICWAHLKRDFTKIAEKPDKLIARIGKNLLNTQDELFKVWYDFKQGHLPYHELIKQSRPIRHKMGEYLEQGAYTDPHLKIARFCRSLLDNFSALWTFLSIQGVEPTNNHAERGLRPAVIWRKKSFGTRSDYGSQFVAQTLSFMTTCKLQTKNSFECLKQTMQCFFAGKQAPLLS